jgi:hypothetical protein
MYICDYTTIQIWHVNDTYKPLYTKTLFIWVLSIEWDIHGCGLLCATADNSMVYYISLA